MTRFCWSVLRGCTFHTKCCVRWLLSRSVRVVCDLNPGRWTPASRSTACSERCNIAAFPWRCSPFSTAESNTEETPAPKKKKKNHNPLDTISNVGRRIPHHLIQVISDTDENLGTMHRVEVVNIMDQQNLKLVLLDKDEDPPIYKLMTGKQIREEQMRLLEKRKSKPAAVQKKDVNLLWSIAPHDLNIKLKQVESWLEKKHHVKITLRARRRDPVANLETTLEQMVQQIGIMVGYVSKPQVIQEGKAAMCVLRLPSAKELSKKDKSKTVTPPPASKSSNDTPKESVSVTEKTEG
ncbi:translation initiation factor IF-3, mitochondrial isoform X2 [Antennarius striatus]|uniref:translation initiation factor IF-3, mitochondrial isoform X2 n=1 Tax=Antennarius striatus TaxID=241820 RepID=UPI0035B21DBE